MESNSNNIIEELVSVNDEDIKRGHIYWSAIPYSEKRPLGLFKHISGVHGKMIIEDANTFKGRFNSEKGKLESEEINVIIKHKRRMVTVIQNENSLGSFIYVLPITTYGGSSEEVEYVKNNPESPLFHYLDSITGKESVVNISDMKRIHKSLLMEKVNNVSIDDNNLEIIGKKLATLMKIEKIEKCDECIQNYKNYIESKEIEGLLLEKL